MGVILLSPFMSIPPESHKPLGAALFNRSWDLLDLGDKRTPEDDDELMMVAFASKLHWSRVPDVTSENLAISDNQIARAAAAAGFADLAVAYAKRTLDRTLEEGWTDWRLASAYEISARAAAAAGDSSSRDSLLAKAREVVATIDDAEDRAVIEGQIDTVPFV
jgi:hypothetical protein